MKKIMSILLIFFMIGLVYAGISNIIDISKDLKVDKEKHTALINKGLDSYEISDYDLEGLKQRCLFKEGVINTCQTFNVSYLICLEFSEIDNTCIVEGYKDYTTQEIEDIMDIWEKELIDTIANAEIKRNSETTKTKTKGGIVSIKEK